jgi:hypothetical protein
VRACQYVHAAALCAASPCQEVLDDSNRAAGIASCGCVVRLSVTTNDALASKETGASSWD